jgi:Holliday junction DNA helicase RuvA
MIGKIKGIVDHIDNSHAIIDVSGVGYIVYCSSKSLSRINVGDKAEFFIETHVREDQITLYGFISQYEKNCFLKLVTVKGVGPKMGLQILGDLEPDQVYLAISLKDSAVLSNVSGVGPKLVSRIFTELKDIKHDVTNDKISHSTNDVATGFNSLKVDAVSALINLGINKSEAFMVVSDVLENKKDVDLNNLIKLSLHAMAK